MTEEHLLAAGHTDNVGDNGVVAGNTILVDDHDRMVRLGITPSTHNLVVSDNQIEGCHIAIDMTSGASYVRHGLKITNNVLRKGRGPLFADLLVNGASRNDTIGIDVTGDDWVIAHNTIDDLRHTPHGLVNGVYAIGCDFRSRVQNAAPRRRCRFESNVLRKIGVLDAENGVGTGISANFSSPNAPTAFTVIGGNPPRISAAMHGLQSGDAIWVRSTGTLPTGLEEETDYYVRDVNNNDFRISSTLGGEAIQFSNDGQGAFSFGGFACYMDSHWLHNDFDGAGAAGWRMHYVGSWQNFTGRFVGNRTKRCVNFFEATQPPSTSMTVHDNTGTDMVSWQSRGHDAISVGSSSVTITHQLNGAPTEFTVLPTTPLTGASGSGQWYIDSITNTHFTVRTVEAVVGVDWEFDWVAKV